MTLIEPEPTNEAELVREDLFSESVPSLQIAWDSTSLGLLKECPRKYQYVILEGWQPSSFAAHLQFGIAYHKALELYDKTKAAGANHDEAALTAVYSCLSYGHRDPKTDTFRPYDAEFTAEPSKTRTTLLRAVIWYLEHFRDDPFQTLRLSNGEPAVELSFKLNLSLETPDGNPFLLAGHLDRVVTQEDRLYVKDRKTTKGELGPRFWNQFTPNNQISLYFFASQLIFNRPADGMIIDAVQLGATFARFRRNILPRPTPSQQSEWLAETHHWLEQATQYALANYWPRNDKSCSNYGGCPFQPICSRDPKVRDRFLAAPQFHKRHWNPLENR